jgi:hypothetical protein
MHDNYNDEYGVIPNYLRRSKVRPYLTVRRWVNQFEPEINFCFKVYEIARKYLEKHGKALVKSLSATLVTVGLDRMITLYTWGIRSFTLTVILIGGYALYMVIEVISPL